MKIPTDRKCCAGCKHFIQHYAWHGKNYSAINAGHCIFYPRVRNRQPGDPPCENWREPSEDYKQQHTPLWRTPPEVKPEKEYCIRVQIFQEE